MLARLCNLARVDKISFPEKINFRGFYLNTIAAERKAWPPECKGRDVMIHSRMHQHVANSVLVNSVIATNLNGSLIVTPIAFPSPGCGSASIRSSICPKTALLSARHKGCYVLYMIKKGDEKFEVVECEKQTAVVAVGGGFAGTEFVPVMISNLGDEATRSFLSFFVDHIRNRNTREAYLRAAIRFFEWRLLGQGLS